MRYATGEQYEGQWKDGMKHGSGVYVYKDGSRYNGLF